MAFWIRKNNTNKRLDGLPGAYPSRRVTYGDSNVKDELDTINSNLSWKLHDTISGVGTKTLPLEFEELCIVMQKTNSYSVSIHIPKIALDSTAQTFAGGSYRDSTVAIISACAEVSTTSVKFVWFYFNQVNETSNSTCRIYYR